MTSSCTVHFVGSVSQPDAESTFRVLAEHAGAFAPRIPDGEVGERFYWIQFQTFRFDKTPGLVRVGDEPFLLRDQFDQRPFALSGEPVVFPDLGYADAALASYADFARLVDEGVIPAETRFQVSIPTPAGVVGAFFVPDARATVEPLYEAAILAEVERIQAAIPHEKLAIQFDAAVEFGWLEGAVIAGYPMAPWFADGFDAILAGVLERLARYGAAVAGGVQLGYHLCYGDVEEQHFIQPPDARVLAAVASGILDTAERTVDWIHLPVPIERDDAAYFAPLAGVVWRDTTVYLGLVHHEDGVEGALRRAAAAATAVPTFGVATECGFGRGPVERTEPLIDVHVAVARALSA